MIYHYFKRYLQFIVSKRKTVISSPARSCFFLSQILAKFVTNISNIVINNAK